MTATPERHMVFIETEKTGRIDMTPEQFDMLMKAALVGLDRMDGVGGFMFDSKAADELHAMLTRAYARHTA